MNNVIIFKPISVMPTEPRTETPHTTPQQVSVRPPACTECRGYGNVFGFATNDPSERGGWVECDRCHGDGFEPTPEPEECE